MYIFLSKSRKTKSIEGLIFVFIIGIMLFSTKHLLQAETLNKDSEILYNSLLESNVKAEKVVLQQYSMISKKQKKKDFYKMKNRIEEVMDIHMKTVTDKHQTNLYKFEGERRLSSNSTLQVAWFGQADEPQSSTLHTHIVIQVVRTDANGWKDDYELLTVNLNKLGIQPNIRSSFQGYVDAIMTMEEQVDFIKKMFTILNGEIHEGISTEDLVSLSGYSKKISHSVVSSSGDVNIQIAARINQMNQSTMITIGNPIIIMEY